MKYEELARLNILEAIRALGYKFDPDGKVRLPWTMETNSPWVLVGRSAGRQCLKWLHVYFQHFNVIHPGCMSCWKTYYFPQTLRELFEIVEQQKLEPELGTVRAAKCGLEKRGFTGRLGGYGAFWYNPLGCGLGKARQNTEVLAKRYGKPLMLKRGCTEMEQFTIKHLGLDSSEWAQLVRPTQRKLALLEQTFELDERQFGPTLPMVRTDAYRRWIEWAAEHGDQTYLDYVDGPFFPKLREYHNSIDRAAEVDDGTVWRDYLKCRSGATSGTECSSRAEETCVTSLENV